MLLAPSHAGHAPAGDDRLPTFTAVITPHRALSRRGLATLLIAVFAISSTVAAICWNAGVWPVSLFVAMNSFMLAAALAGHWASLDRAEIIRLSPGQMEIEHWRRGVATAKVQLAPYSVVLECDDDPDHGCTGLTIISDRRHHRLASDLTPGERATFLDALRSALDEAGESYRFVRNALPDYGWQTISHESRPALDGRRRTALSHALTPVEWRGDQHHE